MDPTADPTTASEAGLREAILASARRLLVRDGYRHVSMRMIARAAGCSVSSIYVHFSSRDELIHTLIDEGFKRWYEETLAIAALDLSPPRRLDRLCRRYVEFALENPELYEIMYLFRPERMARMPKELYRRTRRPMEAAAELVRACDPERFAADGEARLAANLGWALLHGAVSTLLAGRLDSRIDRAVYIDAAIERAVGFARVPSRV